jgi:uncharacterized protein (TIGR03067 family)
MCLSLFAFAGQGRVQADDKANELALLAGEYTAESSVRARQQPATKEALKALTLEISKDGWAQNFRGEIATYSITLDPTTNPKSMQLTHQKVKAVRNCTYVLENDTLTVTEQVGEIGDVVVTVWKRKPMPKG